MLAPGVFGSTQETGLKDAPHMEPLIEFSSLVGGDEIDMRDTQSIQRVCRPSS